MSEIPEGYATLAYWRTLTTRLADDLVAAEAEVERLTAKLQAVRDEYAAALAARDRRILDALAVLDPLIRSETGRYDGTLYALTRVRNALRGDA